MKKLLILTAGLLFLSVGMLSAESVYVSSFRAGLHKSASLSSAKITTAKRGTRLTVLSKKGSWLKVRKGATVGWVKRMFTRKNRSAKFSILSKAKSNANVHARRRASVNVTAASARGLLDAKAPRRGAKKLIFDPAVLDKIESIYISEDSLISFLKEQGIQ